MTRGGRRNGGGEGRVVPACAGMTEEGGAGMTEEVGGGGVQGLFFSGCSGVIRGMVLSGRGAWRCSGLFRFVRICSGLFGVCRRG